MNTYGYIRVSTKEQNEDRRRIAMAEFGVAESNIILDKQSGTNFERPDFKRMIDDIEAGRINTVIVKDLSRFGREYAEMGMYLGSHAPFGYVKDPADRHHIIDPPAADVVRDIFQMFANGVGYVRMTKILRERGVLNPQAYFNQNNPDYFKSEYWRKPYDWHATPIRAILNNRVYLGQIVFGRTKLKGFFDKTRIPAPEDEWIVTENTHESLVTQELWDTVHQMMKAQRRENGSHEVQPFAGLVKCADCGSSLNLSYDGKRGRYTGFSCWVYKNYGKDRCTSHAIGWKTLNTLVLEDIRRNARRAAVVERDYAQMLLAAKQAQQRQGTERQRRKLRRVEKRLAELEKVSNKLYEDRALEKITEERYQSMMPGYEQERVSLQEAQKTLTEAISASEQIYDDVEAFLPLVRQYTDLQELNARILNELIEKIVVHEKERGEDGTVTQQVNIYYKFIGYIDPAVMLSETLAPAKSSGKAKPVAIVV